MSPISRLLCFGPDACIEHHYRHNSLQIRQQWICLKQIDQNRGFDRCDGLLQNGSTHRPAHRPDSTGYRSVSVQKSLMQNNSIFMMELLRGGRLAHSLRCLTGKWLLSRGVARIGPIRTLAILRSESGILGQVSLVYCYAFFHLKLKFLASHGHHFFKRRQYS